jgi:hypothetical protein
VTAADFVAASFWPLAILFAVLLKTVRDQRLWWLVVWAVACFMILYGVLWLIYGESSLVAIVGGYLALAPIGAWALWYYFRCLMAVTRKGLFWFVFSRVHVFLVLGVILLSLSGTTLFADFMQPRIVLEGRVQDLRKEWSAAGSHPRCVAYIAGQRVRVTTPVYEALEFRPVVRVEVGRGSGYVFKVEYLSN